MKDAETLANEIIYEMEQMGMDADAMLRTIQLAREKHQYLLEQQRNERKRTTK